jgi:hypothetical protein
LASAISGRVWTDTGGRKPCLEEGVDGMGDRRIPGGRRWGGAQGLEGPPLAVGVADLTAVGSARATGILVGGVVGWDGDRFRGMQGKTQSKNQGSQPARMHGRNHCGDDGTELEV